jgi:pyruvate,orthophosphate dikinase
MQDIEFTIENQKLHILQTRNGKRTSKAAFQIAVDLVQEYVITKEMALERVEPQMITQFLHPVFTELALTHAEKIAQGLPASPGAVTGVVYFDAESAKIANEKGQKVILLRQETSPEDIEGMIASVAIVTNHGGMTSHAAIIARDMGICCVVGCESLKVNEFIKQATYAGKAIIEGDVISVDGSSGTIYKGVLETNTIEEKHALNDLLRWADEITDMEIRANAETPSEIR